MYPSAGAVSSWASRARMVAVARPVVFVASSSRDPIWLETTPLARDIYLVTLRAVREQDQRRHHGPAEASD